MVRDFVYKFHMEYCDGKTNIMTGDTFQFTFLK